MLRWSLVLLGVVLAAFLAQRASRDTETELTTTPTAGIEDHLRALQRIGSEHGGTRAAGSPGDAATADYIEQRLTAAGYRVSRARFRVPFFRESAPPVLVAGGRRVRPIRTMQFSPGGRAAGRVRAAGLRR